MLLARNPQPHRHRTDRDQDETALQHLAADFDRARPAEPGASVIGVDAVLCKILLLHRWNRIGEGALELDEFVPCDGRLATRDAAAAQPAAMINRFRCAYEHLLGIAAAQCAGAPKREMVDDRDLPTGGAARGSCDRRAGPRPDGDEIVVLGHPVPCRRDWLPVGSQRAESLGARMVTRSNPVCSMSNTRINRSPSRRRAGARETGSFLAPRLVERD